MQTLFSKGGCLREEQALEGVLNVQFQTSFSSGLQAAVSSPEPPSLES